MVYNSTKLRSTIFNGYLVMSKILCALVQLRMDITDC